MTGCGGCARARAHLPAAIRQRLEQVEARIRAKRQAAVIKYSITPPSGTAPKTTESGGDAVLDRGVP